jgi:hypothetical protein
MQERMPLKVPIEVCLDRAANCFIVAEIKTGTGPMSVKME